jgi:hypothetical protein
MYAVYNTDHLRKYCICMLCRILTVQEVTAHVCQATPNKLVMAVSLYKPRCACYAMPSVAI